MTSSRDTLATVVETLSALPQVTGIGLGGSRVTEASDAASDYDVSVFCTAAVPREVRRELALRFGPAPEIGNTWWGESDYWNDGATAYDVMLWDAEWFLEELRRVILEHRPSNGYTTALWFTAHRMEPLFDCDGWLARMQELAATPYPDALLEAIIAFNHPLLRGIHTSYAAQIRRATELDDPVSVNHRIAELLKTVFDIVFAHHRTLHPGEKRQLRALATLPGTAGLDLAIRALLTAGGDPTYKGLTERVDALCDEVDAILISGTVSLPSPATIIDRVTTRGYRLAHRVLKLAWRIFQPTTMGVKIIARDAEGRILLVKARYLEQWTLPGGGVHRREPPEDAAARELREETGIRVDAGDLRLAGLLSSFKEGKNDYVAVYACEIRANMSPIAAGEIADASFFPVNALPDATSERTRRRISEFLAGEVMRGVW